MIPAVGRRTLRTAPGPIPHRGAEDPTRLEACAGTPRERGAGGRTVKGLYIHSRSDQGMKVRSRPWIFTVRRIFRAFAAHGCADIAASLVFYAALALLPASMVGFSILSMLGRDDEAVKLLLEVARAVMPEEASDGLGNLLDELSAPRMSGLLLILGVLLSVWSVSRYVGVLGRGMNRIYGVQEGRRLVALTLSRLAIALVVIVCAATAALLLLGSEPTAQAVGDAFGLDEAVLLAWRIVRWPLLVLLVVFVIAFLYYFAPNVRPPRFRWMSLGAVVTIVVLGVSSACFALYITQLADYDRVYGPLSGVIVFALWLWIANMSLLVGVEFDMEVERLRELRADVPAEAQVQLPLRDARRIASVVRRDRADVAEAHRIRRRARAEAGDRGTDP